MTLRLDDIPFCDHEIHIGTYQSSRPRQNLFNERHVLTLLVEQRSPTSFNSSVLDTSVDLCCHSYSAILVAMRTMSDSTLLVEAMLAPSCPCPAFQNRSCHGRRGLVPRRGRILGGCAASSGVSVTSAPQRPTQPGSCSRRRSKG